MLAADQVDELVRLFPGAQYAEEGGTGYILIPSLLLPGSCRPNRVDVLLCPTGRDGYPSRLFFAQKVECGKPLNWNSRGIRILECNWFAYSWRVRASNLRLVQILLEHLAALR